MNNILNNISEYKKRTGGLATLVLLCYFLFGLCRHRSVLPSPMTEITFQYMEYNLNVLELIINVVGSLMLVSLMMSRPKVSQTDTMNRKAMYYMLLFVYKCSQLFFFVLSLNRTLLRLPVLIMKTLSFPIINYRQIQWNEYYLRLNFMNCENRVNIVVFFMMYPLMLCFTLCLVYLFGYMLCFLCASVSIRFRCSAMFGFRLES